MLIVGLMAVVVQVLVALGGNTGDAAETRPGGGYPDQRHCFRHPVISVYLRRDSRYRRLASRVSHGCLSDVDDCRDRLENHAFAPAAAAAAKADLPFLIEVRVSAVPHRAATEKARDPGAIYLRRFQHAMDDHGHAAHRPFLSHTQTGMFGLAGFAGMLAAARAGKWADRGWAQRTTGPGVGAADHLMASYRLCRNLSALADSWRHCAGLCGTGRSCLQPEPDHCRRGLQRQAAPVGAYMCFYSLGSAAGAIVATQLYSHWGWQAVCLAGAAVSACAFLIWSGSRQS